MGPPECSDTVDLQRTSRTFCEKAVALEETEHLRILLRGGWGVLKQEKKKEKKQEKKEKKQEKKEEKEKKKKKKKNMGSTSVRCLLYSCPDDVDSK